MHRFTHTAPCSADRSKCLPLYNDAPYPAAKRALRNSADASGEALMNMECFGSSMNQMKVFTAWSSFRCDANLATVSGRIRRHLSLPIKTSHTHTAP
mgnify:CR=1 FL=1